MRAAARVGRPRAGVRGEERDLVALDVDVALQCVMQLWRVVWVWVLVFGTTFWSCKVKKKKSCLDTRSEAIVVLVLYITRAAWAGVYLEPRPVRVEVRVAPHLRLLQREPLHLQPPHRPQGRRSCRLRVGVHPRALVTSVDRVSGVGLLVVRV